MARTRKANLPVEDSWRMVEGGENDSFDTAIVQDPFEDDPFLDSSQSQRSSQPMSSQGFSAASQDSIRDFADRADDEEVILRAPFQPSLSTTRHMSTDKDRTPVPEFFMPTIEVDSQNNGYYSPTTDARTLLKRRGVRHANPGPNSPNSRHKLNATLDKPSLTQRFTSSVPEFLFDSAAWFLGTFRMALRYAQWPLAVMFAIYLSIGACMMAKDALVNSVSTPLAPLCQIPGASLLSPTFCADAPAQTGSRDGSSMVEFDELMNVQSQFEKVLEDSAQGVSLPMDMKRSEASVRDLRTMVRYSDLPTREEMVHEFDNYIDSIRTSANDLTMFNTHVGSAVDSVISINRWTSRFIDSIAANREAENNVLSRVGGWAFAPFRGSAPDERALLDKYVEHTSLVSDRIGALILEAQAILRQLGQAEGNLALIHEHAVRTGNAVEAKRSEVFWDVWTLVGANNRRLHNLRGQLDLLARVEVQRSSAARRLDGLLHDLFDIQTKLSDLRDRVASPEMLDDPSAHPALAAVPLAVHIETINAGVERLEAARSRIRAEENERLQQALRRSREDDRLIDG
ncbi:hypothetical protein GGR52DRAFT_553831 [Hypoxylon sp. FL1284]|nr:hypothetical protein GGR52DRAFT_553831 [Hypoxylon sp. FL1284]